MSDFVKRHVIKHHHPGNFGAEFFSERGVMPDHGLPSSFTRSRDGLLSRNPVGLVPIQWPAPSPSTDDFLAEIRRIGFDGIQLGDQVDEESPSLPNLLHHHQIRVAEVYAALQCSPSGPDPGALEAGRSRLETLKALRGDTLVAALDGTPDRDRIAGRAGAPNGVELTDSGWRRLGEVLDQLAGEAVEAGLHLSFHPHAGTYVETPTETHRLLAETDPSSVGLCIDTGHWIVGGGDPVAAIDHHAERITHVHLKDVSSMELNALTSGATAGLEEAVAARIFCPLGSGELDLAGVLTALDGVGYDGWLMLEQDSSWEPPAESSAISRRVLAWAQRHLGERASTANSPGRATIGKPV